MRIPYGKHRITKEDRQAVEDVLENGLISQGPSICRFEDDVTLYTGVQHGVACSSATAGLHMACMALGLKRGEIVWTSSISFVASANCGLYCGAEIDFVDICEESGLVSPEHLEAKLILAGKEGKIPKILIVVHLCGTSCDMKRIDELCKQWGVLVIEDASHALGGKYGERAVGSCEYSEMSIFSFHPVKMITTGEGGMVTTNNRELAERLRMLRSHGITRDQSQFRDNYKGAWHYEQQLLGYNYRMSDINAALGSSQMKRLDKIVEKRNEIARQYEGGLNSERVKILTKPDLSYSSHHLVVARILNSSEDRHRKVFEGMREAGIGVQLHYQPIHRQPFYRERLGCKMDLNNSELYSRCAISLPVFETLTNEEQEYVIETLTSLVYR